MKEALAYDTVTEAEFAAGLLQTAGIPCEVRNETLSLVGEVGTDFTFRPQVWVLRNEDLSAALDILNTPCSSSGTDWNCRSCDAANEAQFDACLSCGAERPSPR